MRTSCSTRGIASGSKTEVLEMGRGRSCYSTFFSPSLHNASCLPIPSTTVVHLPIIEIRRGHQRNLITVGTHVVAVYQITLHRTITTHTLCDCRPAELLHQLHFLQVVEHHLVAVRDARDQVVLVPVIKRQQRFGFEYKMRKVLHPILWS